LLTEVVLPDPDLSLSAHSNYLAAVIIDVLVYASGGRTTRAKYIATPIIESSTRWYWLIAQIQIWYEIAVRISHANLVVVRIIDRLRWHILLIYRRG
jgi:hypothetical protein